MNERIHSIDALRGFALAGIVLVHMVEQFLGAQPSDAMIAGMFRGPLDQAIAGLLEIFVRGKFLALFSFLFGLSFFIQMKRGAQSGTNFQGRFVWRLILLFVIGYAHSLFYRGDILTIYAMLGLLLVPFFAARTNVVLAVAAMMFLGVGRYAAFALSGGEPLFPNAGFAPELPHNQPYYDALLSGSLPDVLRANAWQGHVNKLEFQINQSGRLFLTFGYFLLGLWAGRRGLFEKHREWRDTIVKTMRASGAACVLMLGLTILLFLTTPGGVEAPAFDSWRSMFALTSYDLFNLSLAVVILCAFLLVYGKPRGRRTLNVLAPYGRTALTNYVMQTLVGTFIFYSWGLGYLGRFSNTQALCAALGVIVLQIVASTVWLKYFRYGPLEWLWRSGTWLSWQPMVRRDSLPGR